MRGPNIPVRYKYVCGHGVPVLWTIGHTMTHDERMLVVARCGRRSGARGSRRGAVGHADDRRGIRAGRSP
jgi:hypothetical protein